MATLKFSEERLTVRTEQAGKSLIFGLVLTVPKPSLMKKILQFRTVLKLCRILKAGEMFIPCMPLWR